MKAFKSIILAGLLFAVLAMPCRAQSGSDKIRYHWITQNEVILWKSLTDNKPVTATLDPDMLHWSIPEVSDTSPTWQATLNGIIRQYLPKIDTKKLTYEQSWAFVLTKLRNEYGAVSWAQPREPSAELYLVPKGQDSVEVVINSRVGGEATGRTTALFTKTGNKWSTKDKLSLESWLGINTQSAELRKILGLAERDKVPDGPNTWAETWDKWITNRLASNSPVSSVMYEDAKGKPQWLWRERLETGQSAPAGSRQMPPAPLAIAEPEWAHQTDDSSKRDVPAQTDWLKWALIALAVLFVLALLYYFGFRKTLASAGGFANKIALPFGKGTANASDTANQPVLVTAETLERLHTLVKQRLSPPIQNASPNSEGFTKMLEWIHNEYLTEAKSKGMLQEAQTQWNGRLGKFLQETTGVEKVEGNQLKKWVELGRSAETVVRYASNGLTIPPEVRDQMDVKFATDQPSQEELLTHWPKMVSAYSQCLLNRTKEYNTLLKRFQDCTTKQAGDIKAKEEEVKKQWQERVTTLTTEKEDLDKQRKKAEKELQASTQRISELEGTISTLQGQLKKANEATEAAKKGLAPLEKKLGDIGEVQVLSSFLRKWLQGYFAAQMKDDSELRPVAVVASLLNFSLNQMCFSVVKEQDQLRRVMAHNVFRLTQMFEQQSGGAANLNAVHKHINRIAPEVGETLNEIDKIKLKGDAFDAALFRSFLNRLNVDTGKNLSPFFIEMDAGDNKLVRVSVS